MSASIQFEWDEANIGHLAQHGVQPDEAEQVIRNQPIDLDFETRHGEQRTTQLGATHQGRVLIVVTTQAENRVRIVTAWPAKERLRRSWETQERSRREPE